MNTQLHIVVVEDHEALRELIVDSLHAPNHRVRGFESAESLLENLGASPIDIAVLDLNLPGEDGLSLAKRLRRQQASIGILILTTRSSVQDKVAGYDSGADIYLPKPFAPEELHAAVVALGRRIKPQPATETGYTLDLQRNTLSGPQGQAPLALSEALLLQTFALAAGGRLETWQLHEILGLPQDGKRALEIRLSRLRAKLEQTGASGEHLQAIRNLGYQLNLDLRIT